MLFSTFLSNLHLNLKHQQIFIKLFLEEGDTTELVCFMITILTSICALRNSGRSGSGAVCVWRSNSGLHGGNVCIEVSLELQYGWAYVAFLQREGRN